MYCLDSYALVEIHDESSKYTRYLDEEFVIPKPVLAEFYYVIYKKSGKQKAQSWIDKLEPYSREVSLKCWIDALIYRHEHRKQNLSIFDCIGYIYSVENGYTFVTGDIQFKNKKGVEYVK